MPIEIRELIIKVKVEESGSASSSLNTYAIQEIKNSLLKECKKEIRNQLKKNNER